MEKIYRAEIILTMDSARIIWTSAWFNTPEQCIMWRDGHGEFREYVITHRNEIKRIEFNIDRNYLRYRHNHTHSFEDMSIDDQLFRPAPASYQH